MKIRILAVLVITFAIIAITSCAKPATAGEGDFPRPSDNTPQSAENLTGENLDTYWTAPEGRAPRFLFLHHSTGDGFMFDGGMEQLLSDAGFEVHHRTYGDGWVGDNTDPVNFPETFTEHFDDLISWNLPESERYDIVAFKSCFPASNICSDEDLDAYKEYYETIKGVTSAHPEILFVAFSTPPLTPASTEPECAARARQFNDWLTGEFVDGETNLVAYPLFEILAGDDPSRRDYNCLRSEYTGEDPEDSHPNHDANVVVAENFTEWLKGLVF
jgi:hypothetical protein